MASKIQLFISSIIIRKGVLRLRPRHKDGDVLRVYYVSGIDSESPVMLSQLFPRVPTK